MFEKAKPKELTLNKRRGVYFNALDVVKETGFCLKNETLSNLEKIDLVYRTLCAILYNFVPTSGHPGGSISSGRFVESLLYNTMAYDIADPLSQKQDIISYAAGHKAMGIYAMWALRNELVRIGNVELLPEKKYQLRLEDLLGFRRNPINDTPLFIKYNSKPLDGHPTPETPFLWIATGASGVGVPASFGLAFASLDTFDKDPPFVHIVEGEGGITPGRVYEAIAGVSSARIYNIVLHLDWNQASIDSNRVCREGDEGGDYVQWEPPELFYLNDWNVIFVPDGKDFTQIIAAQELSLTLQTKQPTAIIYRTLKGWKYGIEGKASHGAGHKFCSEGYYNALREFEDTFNCKFPRWNGESTRENIEKEFFDTLLTIRSVLEKDTDIAKFASQRIKHSKERLISKNRTQKKNAPQISLIYNDDVNEKIIPSELMLNSGIEITLRETLGNVLNFLNKKSNGAIVGTSADLLSSTSVVNLGKGFGEGFYNSQSNPSSRIIAVGGICEDAMGAFMAGLSSYGNHIGVTSSYGAFISALEHIAARLHGIGQQARKNLTGKPFSTYIMINAHAGIKTGEDGPTHADPQCLQLLQGNFPLGVLITLTPWEAQELWPLIVAGLKKRPAILAPFVTRPVEVVPDRKKRGLPPPDASIRGIYPWRVADEKKKPYHGSVVLQGSEVGIEFFNFVLPEIDKLGLNINIYYVSSAELFDLLPEDEKHRIYPEKHAKEAIGITGFTLPTMYKWILSEEGRKRSLHPFKNGIYLGSGKPEMVLRQGGLDGKNILKELLAYASSME